MTAAATRAGSAVALAAASIRERGVAAAPAAALILGSGFGELAASLTDVTTIAYSDIPDFPVPTVPGHAGRLHAGRLAGRAVIVFAGRFHLYEGDDPSAAGLLPRLAHALGARTLLISNAAGGVRRTLRPGDLMLISDHINLTFRNPLAGPVLPGEERFPDMSQPYDAELQTVLREAASAAGVRLESGVYAALLGPSYETPAEVRMLERLGADAVGMSTVPEVIVARALGLRCAAISCITNPAAGLSAARLEHADVLAETRHAARDFERLVSEFVRRLEA
ncbi:MAG: purine-nucleoside phosphorylase [Gemmatimonadaceae bacterium]